MKLSFILVAVALAVTPVAEAKVKKTYPLETRLEQIIASAKNDRQRAFLTKALPLAIDIQKRYGIPAAATIAQAALESNYGASDLAKNANNYFGIKSWSRNEPRFYKKGSWYKTFDSMASSFEGYAECLSKPRYQPSRGIRCSVDFVEQVLDCGYCPDPTYIGSVRTIIKRHGLNKLDSRA